MTASVGQAPHEAFPGDADDVERRPCPRCKAAPGSPCRSRSGAVASTKSGTSMSAT
ncbi:zinc finger domain-containing protein [Streptomyces malaysiensis]|uniref:zinc finger domain-containing protein n=1 Tax=Streptomyces malaysiensis TaxID=92644 RepID=UPI0040479668